MQTGPSMRSHDNKVDVVLLSHGNDARIRAPEFHQGLPSIPVWRTRWRICAILCWVTASSSSRHVAGKAPGTSPVPQYSVERTCSSVTRAWRVPANVMAYSSARSASALKSVGTRICYTVMTVSAEKLPGGMPLAALAFCPSVSLLRADIKPSRSSRVVL